MIGEFQKDIRVVRNDAITVEDIKALHPEAIIISLVLVYQKTAGFVQNLLKSFIHLFQS